jgi:Flp pilus assembly protein TadG
MRALLRIARFARDTRAVAAVEFALILPLMLLLYLGGVEGAQLYAVDRKVATVAGTVADLVARTKGVLDSDDLEDYFEAATNILQPGQVASLAQVVTLIFIDEDGAATVEWSRAHGTGVAYGEDDAYGLNADSEISQLARNASGYLVVGEASFPYEPITGLGIPATVDLRHIEYFLPRLEGNITIE